MDRKINFGLIGCGNIGARHAEYISKYGELKAVCDNKEERAKKISSEHNCNSYERIEDLLNNEKQIDVISICTPNYLHCKHTVQSLEAGFNVLCEKPMALTVAECELMIKTSEKYNKRLFVVKQNRFNPSIVELKNIIDNGILGGIYSFQLNCFWNRNTKYYSSSDWKGKKDKDGGILFTQFSHFIDIMYWLLGDIKFTKSILGNYKLKKIIEFEDTGVVIVNLKSGAIGTINFNVTSFDKNYEGSITIFGEKGTVKVGGQYLNTLEYESIKDYKFKSANVEQKYNDYGSYQGSMSNHDKVYENIINVLNNNAAVVTNFLDGLKTVQIIESIYANAINGK
jgi:predicted dehydrogenase